MASKKKNQFTVKTVTGKPIEEEWQKNSQKNETPKQAGPRKENVPVREEQTEEKRERVFSLPQNDIGSWARPTLQQAEKRFGQQKAVTWDEDRFKTNYEIMPENEYVSKNRGTDREFKYLDYVKDELQKRVTEKGMPRTDAWKADFEMVNQKIPKLQDQRRAFERNMQRFENLGGTDFTKTQDWNHVSSYKHLSPQSAKDRLISASEGGNVDLTARTVFDGGNIKSFGWDTNEGEAVTTLTSTYSNPAGTVAMNFTPIGKNSSGEYFVLTPDELRGYAEDVVMGRRQDTLGLKIGKTYEGADAVKQASDDAEYIHNLQDDYYLNGQINAEIEKTNNLTKKAGKGYPWKSIDNTYNFDRYVTEEEHIENKKTANALTDSSYKLAKLFEDQKAQATTPEAQKSMDEASRYFSQQAKAYDEFSTALDNYMEEQSNIAYDKESFDEYKKNESEIRNTILSDYKNSRDKITSNAFNVLGKTKESLPDAKGNLPYDMSGVVMSKEAYEKEYGSSDYSYDQYLFNKAKERLENIDALIGQYKLYYTENPTTAEEKKNNELYKKLETARYETVETIRNLADMIDAENRISKGLEKSTMTEEEWNKLEDKPYSSYNEYLYYLGEDAETAEQRDNMYDVISRYGGVRADTLFAGLSDEEQQKIKSARSSQVARAEGVSKILKAFEEAEKFNNSSYDESYLGEWQSNYAHGWLNLEASKAWNEYAENGDVESLRAAKMLSKVRDDFAKKHEDAMNYSRFGFVKNVASYAPQFIDQTMRGLPLMLALAPFALPVVPVASSSLGVGETLRQGLSLASYAGMPGSTQSGYINMRGAAVEALTDEGLSLEDAKVLATNEAVLSSAIESLSTAIQIPLTFGTKIPSVSKALSSGKALKSSIIGSFKAFGKEGLEKLGLSPKAISILTKGAKLVGGRITGGISEGVEEYSQEMVSSANSRLASAIKKGFDKGDFSDIVAESVNTLFTATPEEKQSAKESAKAGFITGLALDLGMGAASDVAAITADKIGKIVTTHKLSKPVGEQIIKDNLGMQTILEAISYGDKKTVKYAKDLISDLYNEKNIPVERYGKLAIMTSESIDSAMENAEGYKTSSLPTAKKYTDDTDVNNLLNGISVSEEAVERIVTDADLRSKFENISGLKFDSPSSNAKVNGAVKTVMEGKELSSKAVDDILGDNNAVTELERLLGYEITRTADKSTRQAIREAVDMVSEGYPAVLVREYSKNQALGKLSFALTNVGYTKAQADGIISSYNGDATPEAVNNAFRNLSAIEKEIYTNPAYGLARFSKAKKSPDVLKTVMNVLTNDEAVITEDSLKSFATAFTESAKNTKSRGYTEIENALKEKGFSGDAKDVAGLLYNIAFSNSFEYEGADFSGNRFAESFGNNLKLFAESTMAMAVQNNGTISPATMQVSLAIGNQMPWNNVLQLAVDYDIINSKGVDRNGRTEIYSEAQKRKNGGVDRRTAQGISEKSGRGADSRGRSQAEGRMAEEESRDNGRVRQNKSDEGLIKSVRVGDYEVSYTESTQLDSVDGDISKYLSDRGYTSNAVNGIIVDGRSRLEGFVTGNNVYYDTNGDRWQIVGHEIVHNIKKKDSAKYESLKKRIIDNVDRETFERIVDGYEEIYKTVYKKADRDDFIEEVICDIAGNVLAGIDTIESNGNAIEITDDVKTAVNEYLDSVVTDELVEGESGLIEDGELNFDGDETVSYNEDGEPVAASYDDGTVKFSIKTYEKDGKKKLQNALKKEVSSNSISQEDADDIMNSLDSIYQICKSIADTGKYVPFTNWSNAEVVVDKKGKPIMSVVKANGDYKMNLDFSVLCKKRRNLDAIFSRMIERGIINSDTFNYSPDELAKINDIIRRNGFEIACDLCYVEAKRFRQLNVAEDFANIYNNLVKSLVPEGVYIDSFNFAEDLTKESREGIETLPNSKLDFTEINKLANEKKYDKKKGKMVLEQKVENKIARYLKAHPEGRKLLSKGDFFSSKGFENVLLKNPDILKLYNSKKGSGGPKATFGDVQYMSDILQGKKFDVKKAFELGGVRVQSFSDYMPRLVFDYCQMIADMAAKGLPAHSYTKEIMFVKQFGLTGMKINMSLIPRLGNSGIPGLDLVNGKYVYAWADESFPFDEAMKIQSAKGYRENCGTIAVGVSGEQIEMMLGDDRIRMIIPYHTSGINPAVAAVLKIDEYEDYTLKQNTRYKDSGSKISADDLKKLPNYNQLMVEGMTAKEAADTYLSYCDEHNLIPKFDEFRQHKNYYKLLEDFTTEVDGEHFPQKAVTATFPDETSAFGSMKDLIEESLEDDAVREAMRKDSDRVDGVIDEIMNELESGRADEIKFKVGDFKEQLHETLSNQKPSDGNMVYVGETTSMLKQVGLNPKPMLITKGHLRDIHHEKVLGITKYHGLSEDTIAKLPHELDYPAVIFDSISERSPNSVCVLTNLVDDDHLPIIVAIKPDGKGMYNDVEFNSNIIRTMFGKDGPQAFFNKLFGEASKNILYADKKRTLDVIKAARCYLPAVSKQLRFNSIIHKSKNVVNPQDEFKAKVKSTTELEEQIAELKKENTKIKQSQKKSLEKIKRLELQFKKTKGKMLDAKSIRRAALDLKKEFYSNIDTDDLVKMLTPYYEKLNDTSDMEQHAINMMHGVNNARGIAEEIIEQAKGEAAHSTELKRVLDGIKGPYYVPEWVLHDYGGKKDIADIKRRMRKYGMYITTDPSTKRIIGGVDTSFMELQELYPGFFDQDVVSTESDQIMCLLDLAEQATEDMHQNIYEGHKEEMIEEAANAIFEQNYNVKRLKTYADKSKAMFDKKIAEKNRKLQQQKDAFKEKQEKLKQEIREEKQNAKKVSSEAKEKQEKLEGVIKSERKKILHSVGDDIRSIVDRQVNDWVRVGVKDFEKAEYIEDYITSIEVEYLNSNDEKVEITFDTFEDFAKWQKQNPEWKTTRVYTNADINVFADEFINDVISGTEKHLQKVAKLKELEIDSDIIQKHATDLSNAYIEYLKAEQRYTVSPKDTAAQRKAVAEIRNNAYEKLVKAMESASETLNITLDSSAFNTFMDNTVKSFGETFTSIRNKINGIQNKKDVENKVRDKYFDKVRQINKRVNQYRRRSRRGSFDERVTLDTMLHDSDENVRNLAKEVITILDDADKRAKRFDPTKEITNPMAQFKGEKFKNFDELLQFMANTTQEGVVLPKSLINKARTALQTHAKGEGMTALTLEEIMERNNILLQFEKYLENQNKLVKSLARVNLKEAVNQLNKDMPNKKRLKSEAFLHAWDNLPTFAAQMSGGNENNPFRILVDELVTAETVGQATYENEAMQLIAEFANYKYLGEILATKKGAETYTIEAESSEIGVPKKQYTLTKDMLIALYLANGKNQFKEMKINDNVIYDCTDNARHIAKGGITIPNIEHYKKGDFAKAYDEKQGTIRLSPKDIKDITEKYLTEKDRKFADAIYSYFNEYAPERLNKVSLELEGYEFATEDNYFPIVTDANYISSDISVIDNGGSMESPILNQGSHIKRVEGASNPIKLMGAFQSFTKAVKNDGRYVSMAIPISNINKLLNATVSEITEDGKVNLGSVRANIQNNLGSDFYNNVRGILDYVQGTRQRDLNKVESFLSKNYYNAIFALNFKSLVNQLSAIPTEIMSFGVGSHLKGYNPKWMTPSQIDAMRKYSPLFDTRSENGITPELAAAAQGKKHKGKINQMIKTPMVTGDMLVMMRAWQSAYEYGKSQTKVKGSSFYNLEVDSEAFYKEVAKAFNRHITNTQPTNQASTMNLMQLKGNAMNTLFNMFQSPVIKLTNARRQATLDNNYTRRKYKDAKKAYKNNRTAENKEAMNLAEMEYKKAKVKHFNTLLGITLNSLVFKGINTAWVRFRDWVLNKEDEDDEEKKEWIDFLAGFGLDTAGAIFGLPGRLAAMIYDAFVSKYSSYDSTLTLPAISVIDGLFQTNVDAIKWFWNTGKKYLLDQKITPDNELDWKADTVTGVNHFYDMSKEALSALVGIPIGNAEKIVKFGIKGALDLWLGRDKSNAMFEANNLKKLAYKKNAEGEYQLSSDVLNKLYKEYKADNENFADIFDGYQRSIVYPFAEVSSETMVEQLFDKETNETRDVVKENIKKYLLSENIDELDLSKDGIWTIEFDYTDGTANMTDSVSTFDGLLAEREKLQNLFGVDIFEYIIGKKDESTYPEEVDGNKFDKISSIMVDTEKLDDFLAKHNIKDAYVKGSGENYGDDIYELLLEEDYEAASKAWNVAVENNPNVIMGDNDKTKSDTVVRKVESKYKADVQELIDERDEDANGRFDIQYSWSDGFLTYNYTATTVEDIDKIEKHLADSGYEPKDYEKSVHINYDKIDGMLANINAIDQVRHYGTEWFASAYFLQDKDAAKTYIEHARADGLTDPQIVDMLHNIIGGANGIFQRSWRSNSEEAMQFCDRIELQVYEDDSHDAQKYHFSSVAAMNEYRKKLEEAGYKNSDSGRKYYKVSPYKYGKGNYDYSAVDNFFNDADKNGKVHTEAWEEQKVFKNYGNTEALQNKTTSYTVEPAYVKSTDKPTEPESTTTGSSLPDATGFGGQNVTGSGKSTGKASGSKGKFKVDTSATETLNRALQRTTVKSKSTTDLANRLSSYAAPTTKTSKPQSFKEWYDKFFK